MIKLCIKNYSYRMKFRGTSSTPIWSNFGVFAEILTNIHTSWQHFVVKMQIIWLIHVPKMVQITWSSEVRSVHLYVRNEGSNGIFLRNALTNRCNLGFRIKLMLLSHIPKIVHFGWSSEVPPVLVCGRN